MFDDQRFAAKRSPRTAEYWLTEEQALFVTTQARTPTARAITLQVIRAFIAARHALNKPVLDQKLVERIELAVGPLLDAYKLLDKRLGRLESGGGFSMRPMLLVPGSTSRMLATRWRG
ncbi:hypothetical protein [Polyangium mundeleinium]|uniref:DUF4158 domain-containing protein n=1 Tax=Polyangium mundeleinium TaxID=2995306 RepID=A0ABT5EGG9_9BACT|nr:hypothetical protein [Polyangium mundeleinium]MDC0740915.1 hypothetical protein [Polyangium mundeleinium]